MTRRDQAVVWWGLVSPETKLTTWRTGYWGVGADHSTPAIHLIFTRDRGVARYHSRAENGDRRGNPSPLPGRPAVFVSVKLAGAA